MPKARRESCWSCPHPLLIPHQRLDHPGMRMAAADDAIQRPDDFVMRRSRVLIDECLPVQHRAADAEAALDGLFIDEGFLNRVQVCGGAQALDGDYRAPRGSRYRRGTRAH